MSAKDTFATTAKGILRFFSRNIVFLIFYTLLPSLWAIRCHGFGWPNIILHSVALNYLVAVIICLIGDLLCMIVGRSLGKPISRLWHLFWHIVVYSISFIDVYLYFSFGIVIREEAITLLLQTNTSEACEFLKTDICQRTFLVVVLGFIMIAFVEYALIRYRNKISFLEGKWITIMCLLYLLCGFDASVHALRVFRQRTGVGAFGAAEHYRGNYSSRRWNLTHNLYIRLYYGFMCVSDNLRNAKNICDYIDDTRVKSQTCYTGDIVLIIGESHIKQHSSLYGYDKETNPLLKSMGDSLCIFQDVISPMNATHIVFSEILSVSSLDDGIDWYHTTLFPAVFKDAGWNVVFCSNQVKDTSSNDVWNASLDAFLNVPKVSDACFTTRNTRTYRYDGEMVDSLILNKRQNLDINKPTLYILNLSGQHVDYAYCSPDDEKYFSVADYSSRTELSNAQKQDVADYDNACRYNDKQIYRLMKMFSNDDAIIIYISDHGDEVHDYREHVGRAHDLSKHAPYSYHCQIDVPFVVYMSEDYKRNHLEKAELIQKSVNKPFMTDDICHMLFYLGDVDTEWYDATRCLIHPDFNINRRRILHTGEDYDKCVSSY